MVPPGGNSQDTHRVFSNQIHAGYYPPHEREIKLEKMADGITELVAHLDAGTFQLLKLICVFDKEEGWAGEGVLSSATAPALLYLLHPCSRAPTG